MKKQPFILLLSGLILISSVMTIPFLRDSIGLGVLNFFEQLFQSPITLQKIFYIFAIVLLLIVFVLKAIYRKKDIFSIRNDLSYISGFLILGIGVNLALRSTIGAGPWDTVTYSLRALINNTTPFDITLGTSSFIINTTIMLIVILYRRNIRYLFMVIPLLFVSLSIDFADLVVLGDIMPTDLYSKVVFFIGGLIFIPLGISLIIHSSYPAFVFDEMMLMFMDIFHTKKMAYIRISHELFALSLAVLFGFLAGIGFGQVNIGSLIIAVSVGPLISLFTKSLSYSKVYPEKIKREAIHAVYYLLGSICIALGVVLILRSNIGLSSWDTLHYSLHKLLNITIGTATVLVASLVTLFIVITKKELHYFFMAIPIILVGGMIDLFNEVLLVDFHVSGLINRSVVYLIGLLILPFGGAMLIISTFPAGVFDELMLLIMKLANSNKMTKIRVIMELSAVTLAIILGFMAGIGFGMVSIGTLIFSLSVGVLIKLYLKLLERIGLYEFE